MHHTAYIHAVDLAQKQKHSRQKDWVLSMHALY